MQIIESLEELYGTTVELFVWVVCPKCKGLSIVTMPVAEDILTFGCVLCAEFESSDMLVVPTVVENVAEAEQPT